MLIAKIPGKLNNRTLVSVLEFMRRSGLIFRKKRLAGISSRNYSANADAMRNHESEGHESHEDRKGHEGRSCENRMDEKLRGESRVSEKRRSAHRRSENRRLILINDQREFSDVRLGRSDLSYSGCEVIAAYNLLQSIDRSMAVDSDHMKYPEDHTMSDAERGRGTGRKSRFHAPTLPELISGLEKKGLIRSGYFGISPKYLAGYIKSLSSSFEVFFTTDEKLFDEVFFSHDHFILTVMNDRDDIFKQIHTFYISKSYTDHLRKDDQLRPDLKAHVRADQKAHVRTDQKAQAGTDKEAPVGTDQKSHVRTEQKAADSTDQKASEGSGKVTGIRSGILIRAYNAGINGYYRSVTELIKDLPGGRAKGICLIGVRLKTAGRKSHL